MSPDGYVRMRVRGASRSPDFVHAPPQGNRKEPMAEAEEELVYAPAFRAASDMTPRHAHRRTARAPPLTLAER
jgi:hypothetical protein